MGQLSVIISIGLITVATCSETGLRLLFPIENRQYIYELKTNVSISTQPVSNKSSLWLLEGVLVIQSFDNFTKARIHLDVRRKTLIGNTGNYDFYELEGDKFLKNPWELDYQDNGFIKSIYVSEEPTWCVNLKRAISVNFQLTRNAGATSTYSMNEPCLDEICVMVYTIRGNSIRKYTSFRVPTARSSYSWGSVPWNVEYTGLLYVDSISASERNYEMDSQKGLITLDLKGSYQYKTHDHLLSVTSDLYLNFKEDIPAKSIDKLNLSQTTIQYVAGDFSDPTNGIANFTQFHLTNKSYTILLKIARKGIDADNIVRNASLIHNLDFIELLNTMSQLHYESLIKLFNDLVLGTSYDMETSRNIFLEILPHLRSDACARFIKYLVLEEKEKVEDAALLSLIRKLPFNIATHSQSLLEELEVFTKLSLDFSQDIRHAGILSFATLAHKTMAVAQVKQDYFENLVVKYFRMYSDCPRYLDRMVWLQGLCNIGYSAEAYTRIIYADSGRNKHERLWAALAGSPKTEAPYMVLETTLPVLTNDTEDIQLRIIAVHMFLSSSNVRETDFIFVHNYILNCENKHLRRFWFSTVKNLVMNRDFTGYRVASFYIPFIANQVPYPSSQDWATNNYIISGTQEDGAPSMQVLSVGDDLGALPGFVGLKLYTGGRRPYKAAIYVITEGVVANIKDYRRIYEVNPQDINAEKLFSILQGIKTWGLKKAEKLHIDVVVKIHDKTVFATHMNQTRFEKWNVDDFAYIVDFLRFGSHINQQIVYYPFQTDVHLSTELGTPIRLQSTILSFTSIRGNLTAPTNDDITWKNDLHIRYQGTAVTTLATAAPLLQTVHVARIQQSLVAHMPMKFNISLSNTDEEVVLTWPNPGDQQAGVAMHSRAEVTTETKTEGYDFMLKKGEIENRKDSIFFDCERPMTGAEVLNKLLASNTKYQDFFHSIQPSLVILNGIVLFSSPPSGSCGVIIQPRVTGSNDVLQVSVTLDRLKYNDVLQVGARCRIKYFSLENPDRELIKVEADSKFQKTDGHASIELKIHGHHSTSGDTVNNEWMVCLNQSEDIDTSFHKDTSNSPAPFDGTLTLAFNGHQNSCSEALESQLLVEYHGEPELDGDEFRMKFYGRNLSRMGVLEKMDWISQTPWGQLMKSNTEDPLNVTAVIKERQGLTTLKVNNSPEMKLHLENFAWLLDRWTDTQIKKNFGFYRECRLHGQNIQAFSGDTKQLPNSQCEYDLLAADCSDNSPRFAVFRVTDGVKVYSGGYNIHLKYEGGSITIDQTNGGEKFGIFQKEEMYKVSTKNSNILVYYQRDSIVLLIPRLYVSTLCGICVDLNEFNVC